jgi:hypothetical protein
MNNTRNLEFECQKSGQVTPIWQVNDPVLGRVEDQPVLKLDPTSRPAPGPIGPIGGFRENCKYIEKELGKATVVCTTKTGSIDTITCYAPSVNLGGIAGPYTDVGANLTQWTTPTHGKCGDSTPAWNVRDLVMVSIAKPSGSYCLC